MDGLVTFFLFLFFASDGFQASSPALVQAYIQSPYGRSIFHMNSPNFFPFFLPCSSFLPSLFLSPLPLFSLSFFSFLDQVIHSCRVNFENIKRYTMNKKSLHIPDHPPHQPGPSSEASPISYIFFQKYSMHTRVFFYINMSPHDTQSCVPRFSYKNIVLCTIPSLSIKSCRYSSQRHHSIPSHAQNVCFQSLHVSLLQCTAMRTLYVITFTHMEVYCRIIPRGRTVSQSIHVKKYAFNRNARRWLVSHTVIVC